MADATCPRCATPFAAKKSTQRFCTSKCQQLNNRAETKAKRLASRRVSAVCPGCELTFVPVNGKQTYCGVTCGKRLQTRKRLGLYAPPVSRPCDYCSVEFSSPDGRAKYCGDECARTAKSLGNARYLYGITMAEFRDMMRQQNGKCAICLKPERSERNRLLTIDHDHVTGHIRGLLCSHCNRAIGLLQDDPRVIAAAAGYVKRTRQMPLFT